MNGFVGWQLVDDPETVLATLKPLGNFSPYYFLRWHHRVSGLIDQSTFETQYLPKGLSPVGQVFTQSLELRWERRSRRLAQKPPQYHLLLLGRADSETPFPGFTPLQEHQAVIPWKTVDYNAVLPQEGGSEGTRFPKGFIVSPELDPKSLRQRHFIHKNTGITHFVALVSQV
ncbi:hypothetical protein [Prochlorothrix hollandica]|uniref:Uncharacterized protein n=1 Tax=Prochlorothrix hollandica PCC 9006 = CALU 1027 TaxID=317619 RepID=A0A0M2PTS1_PROHO|nr:hypothetical protein [Prochlorothrix hollandica]KKI99895.1 hypothetical protein PROH_08795 [Prochlorothrix hollandica PCC 9006 = CALU 1027]